MTAKRIRVIAAAIVGLAMFSTLALFFALPSAIFAGIATYRLTTVRRFPQ